jgi:poly(3-hydroxybutyrate) depolymerase
LIATQTYWIGVYFAKIWISGFMLQIQTLKIRPKPAMAVLICTLVVLFYDCSKPSNANSNNGDDRSSVTPDPTPTPGPTPSPARQPTANDSAGCGKTGQATGALDLTISDGKTPNRSYKLKVPTNYNPQIPLPIVMAFHGLGGSSDAAIGFGIQNAQGASTSAIFVYPQGSVYTGTTEDAEVRGQVGWFDQCGSVDMTFVKNILASIEANYCVDQKRIFAAGFSWGCDFVTALNCCDGTLLRGISAASCTDEYNKGVVANVSDPNYYLNYYNLNSAGVCRGKGSAAIRFTHDSSGGDAGYVAPSFTHTSHLYRSMNSCSNTSTAVDSTTLTPVSSSACSSFNSCASPFVECSYRNLGHALPANWGSDTWQFFSSFK